jgi:NAD+ kinase
MSVVGILVRSDLGEAGPALHALLDWLGQRGVEACVERDIAALLGVAPGPGVSVAPAAEVGARAGAVVVLGGDGTLLAASHVVARPIPVLGVNFGSLGFLTENTLAELFPALESVLEGRYRYEERHMLHAELHRGGSVVVTCEVLNDVVITKATMARIITLDVTIDGLFVSTFRADGLLVCTPTGSTAYNLAAGGPILYPTLPAVVLTPICPHMLSNRPLVVGEEATIEVSLASSRDGDVHVAFDGQRVHALQPHDRVVITCSTRTLRLVRPPRDYFEVLRTKLKWGESARQ